MQGLADFWRNGRSLGQLILRTSKQHTCSAPFKCQPSHPEPTPPTTSFVGFSYPDHYLPALITLGSDARSRFSPSAPEPTEIFKIPSIKTAYPPHLFFPTETTVKALAHISPCYLCLLTDPAHPHVALQTVLCLLFPGICEYDHHFHIRVSYHPLATCYFSPWMVATWVCISLLFFTAMSFK